jgi:phospholipid/cholesterol/gamma-HCH transport system substrate-binding protein
MSGVRKEQRRDRIRIGVFLGLSGLATAYLVTVTADYRGGSTEEYAATFHNVSGLQVGDPVRISGVDEGRVTDLEVRADNTIAVRFDVAPDVVLNTSTTAAVRYSNLIGDRYLELARPDASAPALAAGASLDVKHTESALDLDALLNGFKPLFVGLAPQQINALSRDLVAVLNGQSSAVDSLLATLGEVAGTLGDRQQLIGDVVGNLNTLLGTVDERSSTLGDLIDQLSLLAKGLQAKDGQLVHDVAAVTDMAGSVSGLVGRARGDVGPVLDGLTASAAGLNKNADTLKIVLDRLPKHYTRVLQTASYGNFFNFFLCGIRIDLGSGTTPWITSDLARCKR